MRCRKGSAGGGKTTAKPQKSAEIAGRILPDARNAGLKRNCQDFALDV